MKFHIGLDDTDSRSSGCTTYVASVAIERLLGEGVRFVDYPNLIRLNPNIPWKTKGNGAVALRIETQDPQAAFETVVKAVVALSQPEAIADTAVIMLASDRIPGALEAFSSDALYRIVPPRMARRLAKELGCRLYHGSRGRGIVGALAAIGCTLEGDHTFELLAYRERSRWGTPRAIDHASVLEMDIKTKGKTFNNLDPESGRILINPRGGDPVLFGIRGEMPEAILEAASLLNVQEPVERLVIFRSNQGTDAHLQHQVQLCQLRPYMAATIKGTVSGRVSLERGGHIFFLLSDDNSVIRCGVYEPAGGLRNLARSLRDGDLIEVCGGVRRASSKNPRVVNVERIRVVRLASYSSTKNPICPSCNRSMESAGRAKGFRCNECGTFDRAAVKLSLPVPRTVSTGLHLPPPRAQRHLTRPLARYGVQNQGVPAALHPMWFRVSPSIQHPSSERPTYQSPYAHESEGLQTGPSPAF